MNIKATFLLVGGACLLLSPLGLLAQPAACSTDPAYITQQRGIVFEPAMVQPGQWYWKLTNVSWCLPEQDALRINIFYRCRDANGNQITNQRCIAAWPFNPTNTVNIFTKAPPDWGDFPMAGGSWCPSWPAANGPYNAWVDSACPANGSNCPPQASYPSDKVRGMGLPCNHHETYYLTWQFTQASGPPAPAISRSPASFTRTVSAGQNLPSDQFTVQNAGGGTLNYTITDNAGWLSVNPAAGSSTGESDPIAINYNTTGLGLGQHNATITITDAAAGNSPQTIGVSVTVETPTVVGDFDGDGDVDLTDFGRFQLCLTGAGIVQGSPSCAWALLDEDFDVDGEDVAVFLNCMSGANVPQTDPACID